MKKDRINYAVVMEETSLSSNLVAKKLDVIRANCFYYSIEPRDEKNLELRAQWRYPRMRTKWRGPNYENLVNEAFDYFLKHISSTRFSEED